MADYSSLMKISLANFPSNLPGLEVENFGIEMTEWRYPAIVAWDGTVGKLGAVVWNFTNKYKIAI